MPGAHVAYMKLDTQGRAAILQMQVESPVTELSASPHASDMAGLSRETPVKVARARTMSPDR